MTKCKFCGKKLEERNGEYPGPSCAKDFARRIAEKRLFIGDKTVLLSDRA